MKFWGGQLGKDYTDRNTLDITALDALYTIMFGVSRSAMKERFLSEMPRDAKILEVGSRRLSVEGRFCRSLPAAHWQAQSSETRTVSSPHLKRSWQRGCHVFVGKNLLTTGLFFCSHFHDKN
jgi:hypothetical protein